MIKNILMIFFAWRIILMLVALFAIIFVPLAAQDRYLGGGPILYKTNPGFFSWANFDGEHYLSIAIFGYKGLEQAFFPIYPLLISLLAKPFSYDLSSAIIYSILSGIIISHIFFLLSLIFLWKLIRIDFASKIAFLTLITMLLFPTAFYFGAVYSESVFLLLAVLSIYFARKKKWWVAGILGGLSSATRIFGLLLFPVLLVEAWQQKLQFKQMIWLFLIPCGLGIYMLYQYYTIGDAFAFYKLQKLVGEQHQSGITLLPQVYFRYIKMLATTNFSSPIYQTIVLELICGLAFFLLPVYGYFKKIRLSYLVYAMLGFLTPTIQGSFSSVPRYVIVFFPSFLAMALFLDRWPKKNKIIYFAVSLFALAAETALFLRGYWVA